MQKFFIAVLLLAFGSTADAQKLKDLLYSGKLRSDSNTVVRRSDDLSTKIDTATRKPAEPEKPAPAIVAAPSRPLPPVTGSEPSSTVQPVAPSADSAAVNPEAGAEPTAAEPVAPVPVRNNTKIWKAYADSLLSAMKTEVLSSKRLKKETYYVIAEYEIGPDGTVTVGNVSATPENAFLQSEVKTRMEISVPQLIPVTDSTGKPRKTKRKWSFTLTKD